MKTIKLGPEVKASLTAKALTVIGPGGPLSLTIPSDLEISVTAGSIDLNLTSRRKNILGLYGSLIKSLVDGVRRGFRKELELVGVGFKVKKEGRNLVLNLGYSHPVRFEVPVGVEVEVDDETHLVVSGPAKGLVGETAALIRGLKKPEPYKGKGVRYVKEVVRRKAGKAAKAGVASK